MTRGITYLRHEQIDRRKWDRCIEEAINGHVYAWSWYLDSVCDQWDAMVEGDYDSVFPLPWRSRMGIRYVYQPPFTQQLGLFTRGQSGGERLNAFLDALPAHFRLTEIQLNAYNRPSHPAYSVRMRPNLVMDLIPPYEIISGGYSQNLKRHVRKAAASGWIITEDVKPSRLIRLFRENRGRELKTLNDRDYERLERLTAECSKRACLHLLGSGPGGGEPDAGVIFAESHGKLVLLFSATGPEARQQAAMAALIDYMIRKHAGKNLVLDFEGSEDPGMAQFYGSFGAVASPYPFIRKNSLGPFTRFAAGIFKPSLRR
ncbi:MAG TPA: GNAT family N-acetyltransferase [Bacteroidales bacterium]|nr:GNAT family N-acetyltransferase [Bacteroidales bacterium]HSA43151.1 GNAT family N-acetyltransferase [Bacteroidales bacterium]